MQIKIGKFCGRFERQDLEFLVLFIASAVNASIATILFSVVAVHYLFIRKDNIGLLKGLVLWVLRSTAMNSLLFRGGSYFGSYRYILIFLFVIGMIAFSYVEEDKKNILKRILIGIAIFTVVSLLGVVINSSYPIVSAVKLFLYIVAFYAVLKTIASTCNYYDWISYFSKLFGLIFFISIFVIPIMSFRTRNGHAFQGILNHPNMFGCYAPVFISLLCINKKIKSYYKIPFIMIVLYMVYISESRTGMLASLVIIGSSLLIYYKDKANKLVFTLIAVFVIGMIVLVVFSDYIPGVKKIASDFIWKGYEDNLFYSKRGPIRRFTEKFAADPFLGTGFMVPYDAGIRSMSMTFDMYVEDANVFLSVLGGSGIVGFAIWLFYNMFIFIKGNKELLSLFIAPFIISSGEMVFFSTNSVGLMFYVLFGIYLFDKNSDLVEGYQ